MFARELIFNFINFPAVPIIVPYNNQNIVHTSTVRVSGNVADNSDIPERMIPGQFTRLTLSLNIDDAYLWDVRSRNNVRIGDVGLKIYKDKLEDDMGKTRINIEKINI